MRIFLNATEEGKEKKTSKSRVRESSSTKLGVREKGDAEESRLRVFLNVRMGKKDRETSEATLY